MWAEDEADVLIAAAPDAARRAGLLARRVAGEPLELVVGWAEFAGLRIVVEPGVFVPRRRSEFLVDLAAVRVGDITSARMSGDPAAGKGSASVVLDLCCGTGALGAALVARLGPDTELHACDLDPDAVRCARRNVPASATVYEGELFAPLPPALRGRVDVLLANAPYVPHDEIALLPAEARRFEHRLALDGGADGLALHRRIAVEAPVWLAPGGVLLIEVSARQQQAASAMLHDAGLRVEVRISDGLDALVLLATRPG